MDEKHGTSYFVVAYSSNKVEVILVVVNTISKSVASRLSLNEKTGTVHALHVNQVGSAESGHNVRFLSDTVY